MIGLFILSFLTRWKKRTLEEEIKEIQKGNQELQNQLIEKYKPFIAKTVSSVCKKYIRQTDDEFSIGLIAFNDAVVKYDETKGQSLLSFAEVIIKRRVIDYIRSQGKFKDVLLEKKEEDRLSNILDVEMSIDEFQRQREQSQRREEILQFSKQLKYFDLTVQDLVSSSPQHRDARENAIYMAKMIANDLSLYKYVMDKKRLPIKELEKRVNISRKTIERNRKYIIAIVIIIRSDYVFMKEYLKGVLKA